MIRYIIPIISGIVVSAPALAQDANHIRIDGQIYDIRTLGVPLDAREADKRLHDERNDGIVLRGMNRRATLDEVQQGEIAQRARQALVAAGCLRPDETNLSRHDCYVNSSGDPVHRPARDDKGRP